MRTKLTFFAIAALLVAMIAAPSPAQASIPQAAARYHRALVSESHASWGLDAPVAVFGAQIQQESGWNPQAHSAVAAGLAEFTPQTATWISGAYPKTLASGDPYNPAWAIRALTTYDHDLWNQTAAAPVPATACDHMAFALSAYNGGIGWVYRDQKLTQREGADPSRWWGNVERFTSRAAAASRENRGYPHRILLVLQPEYTAWGPGVACST